jgi:serine/threonine protein kinase
LTKVIGEGKYGCVHKPMLSCKTKQFPDASGRVSKIMSKDNVAKELREYNKIKIADPKNEFYLGVPETCILDDSDTNRKNISDCKLLEVEKRIQDYRLIIMKDGGRNLSTFFHEPWTKEKLQYTFLEIHRLIKGIKLFLENGFVHHDLKPQNVVNNSEHFYYIDFGLMASINKLTEDSRNSVNTRTTVLWNFPFEIEMLNKNRFMQLHDKTYEKKQKTIEKWIERTNHPKSGYHVFFSNLTFDLSWREKILSDIYPFLMNLTANDYERFLSASLNTIDIYGLGTILIELLNQNSKMMKEMNVYDSFAALCYRMIHPNVFLRIPIDHLLIEYEKVLEEKKTSLPKPLPLKNKELEKAKEVSPKKKTRCKNGTNWFEPLQKCMSKEEIKEYKKTHKKGGTRKKT